MTVFNLRTLKLRSGEQFADERDVTLQPLELGGQRYLPVPEAVPAGLTITKAATGTVFDLSFDARMHGPCYRCLNDAVLDLPIQAREYQATDPSGDEELRSPYIENERLDLSAWAHDALALALPEQILCRADCAGLCTVCGKDLNAEPHEHEDAAGDARWAALADLRDRL